MGSTETGKSQRATSAKQTMDGLMEISKILNTGLDMDTLATVVRLCESGVNPEALAHVFNELRKESASIKDTNEKNKKAQELLSHPGLMGRMRVMQAMEADLPTHVGSCCTREAQLYEHFTREILKTK